MGEDNCNLTEKIGTIDIGNNTIDNCIYETQEAYANVTIEILKCPKCGKTTIAWRRQEDTIDLLETMEDADEYLC